MLQHLHSENKLSKRFPIGLEEQIKKWDADKIRKFHERWYFPSNATLYIVGDIDNVSKTIDQIEVYPKLLNCYHVTVGVHIDSKFIYGVNILTMICCSSQAVFGQTGNENETTSTPTATPSAFGAMASFLVPKLSVGLPGNLSHERSSNSADQSKIMRRERHAVRPPVEHNWSLPGRSADFKPPQIFQHELLQNFSINMFCKV